ADSRTREHGSSEAVIGAASRSRLRALGSRASFVLFDACERALPCEVRGDLFGGLATDEGREFSDRRLRDARDGAKVAQQTCLAFVADAGDGRQLRSEVAYLAPLAVIGDGGTVRLVADHLNQAQDGRMR